MAKPVYTLIADRQTVEKYLRKPYNHPEFNQTFSKEDFEREFDEVYNVLMDRLSEVGTVEEGSGEADYLLYRYVSLNRCITVVVQHIEAMNSSVIQVILDMLEGIAVEYLICLEAHPLYVFIFKDGRVLGYAPDTHADQMAKLGFI